MGQSTTQPGLSVDSAIRIAKIIATAPASRMPMISQVFSQASVDLEGLEELLENEINIKQNMLIDTEEFLSELIEGREKTARGYLFTPEEFSLFCIARGIQPLMAKRYLFLKGIMAGSSESNGKTRYSIDLRIDGAHQRRIAINPPEGGAVR